MASITFAILVEQILTVFFGKTSYGFPGMFEVASVRLLGAETELPKEAGDLFQEYDDITGRLDELKEKESLIKNKMMDLLQTNEVGIWYNPAGGKRKATWKAPKASESVKLSDIKKKDMNEYGRLKAKGFITIREATRRLRIY